jgi:hypothetical protein
MRECELLCTPRHINVVTFYGISYEEDEKRVVLVTEFCPRVLSMLVF